MENLDPKLLEYIDKLAKAFGTTSIYLWTVLVKQGYLVLGKQLLYLFLIYPFIVSVSLKVMYAEIRRAQMEATGKELIKINYKEGIFVGYGLAIFISTVIAISIYVALVTPEMYAVQVLFETFK